ncbi:MAG TPA: methionine--tRNA ligase [Candidatus Saccharimonadales bacterium]|nr:methionine--tRNA ligase [Candidatus Saccharimonadales bacterium]
MTKYYITTTIFYINDKPHIGHAYDTIAADVLARYWRAKLGKDKVWFLTGTDENSKKTVESAKEVGQEIEAYTNTMAKQWQSTWDALGISYNRFIRTSEPDHEAAVRDVVTKIHTAGDITKGIYEGLYCYKCEMFYKEDELIEGLCPVHKTPPEFIKEENYFFKLSKYQDALKKHIDQHPDFIQPESRRNEVLAFIDRGLEDISISRANQTLGIKLPFDPSQVVYVWVDALINYLTGVGYPKADYKDWWPADLHVIGKDIIKFHCIIWPAMLLSAGLELPKRVVAHGFFTVDGEKISKSLGNGINPLDISETYGVDALRYYLLSEFPFGADGNFSQDRLSKVYQSNLANELGNLVQRVAKMAVQYLDGQIGANPPHTHDVKDIEDSIENYHFEAALKDIWVKIRGLNQMVDEEKPWVLAKTDKDQLEKVLKHIISDLLQITGLLAPFLPTTAEKIQKTLGGSTVDTSVGILFPKVESNA